VSDLLKALTLSAVTPSLPNVAARVPAVNLPANPGETTDGADALRLTNCPQCEYSLTGLPDEGICPECGWAYDRGAVIVRCQGPGGLRWPSWVLVVLGTLAAGIDGVLLIMWPRALLRLTQMLAVNAIVVAFCAITLLERALSPRKGEWLLWITPAGIGVQSEFDPDSMLAHARRLFAAWFLPLFISFGFFPVALAGQGRMWYVGVGMMIAYGLGFFWFGRKVLPRPGIPASGARPGLFAWDAINDLRIGRQKSGRYRLRATRRFWLNQKQPVLDVSFESSDDRAAQIRQRIAQWSGKEPTVDGK